MSTDELRQKIDANGLEHVLWRYENEPTDNPEIAKALSAAFTALLAFEDAAAKVETLLRRRTT